MTVRVNGQTLLPQPLPFGLPRPPAVAPQLPAGITLAMIVRNEEATLERCLNSVRDVVDEVVVVDTGSTDRTRDVAEYCGARIFGAPWTGDFAAARNVSLALATYRWILVLDADEELLAGHDALRTLRDLTAALTGLWVRIHNRADDYAGTGTVSHVVPRIFPNDPRIRYRGRIHEYPTVDGRPTGIECVASPVAILHHGYLTDAVAAKAKAERNVELVEAELAEDPDDPFRWYNAGMAATVVGDRDKAIFAFERVLAIVGEQPRAFVPSALCALAEVYGERDPDAALRAATEALRRSPNLCNAHYAAGRALEVLGRLEEARAMFEAALADEPHNGAQFIVDDQVTAWKSHAEIANTYFREGRFDVALEWIDRAAAKAPLVEIVRLNRARVLEALGRFADAEEAFRATGDGREVANFLLRRGRNDEALALLDDGAAATVRAALADGER